MKKLKWVGFLFALTMVGTTYAATPLQSMSVEGTTLVPLRTLSEALGVQVGYEPSTREISVATNNVVTKMFPNNNIAEINGFKTELAVAPQVVEGTTYVPLRFVGEAIGATINYNNGIIETVYNGEKNMFTLSATSTSQAPTLETTTLDIPFKRYVTESAASAGMTVENLSIKADSQFYNYIFDNRVQDTFGYSLGHDLPLIYPAYWEIMDHLDEIPEVQPIELHHWLADLAAHNSYETYEEYVFVYGDTGPYIVRFEKDKAIPNFENTYREYTLYPIGVAIEDDWIVVECIVVAG